MAAAMRIVIMFFFILTEILFVFIILMRSAKPAWYAICLLLSAGTRVPAYNMPQKYEIFYTFAANKEKLK